MTEDDHMDEEQFELHAADQIDDRDPRSSMMIRCDVVDALGRRFPCFLRNISRTGISARGCTGLCVGQAWVGEPARNLDPWRDTGIEVRGPAVADIEAAFARSAGDTSTPLAPRPTSIKTLEWEHIHEVLKDSDFNISETARRLGMHRRTLARKLAKRQVG